MLLFPADVFLGEDGEAVGTVVGQALLYADHLRTVGEGEDTVVAEGLRFELIDAVDLFVLGRKLLQLFNLLIKLLGASAGHI